MSDLVKAAIMSDLVKAVAFFVIAIAAAAYGMASSKKKGQ